MGVAMLTTSYTFSCKATATIAAMQKRLASESGVPVCEQMLVFAVSGERIKKEGFLSDLGQPSGDSPDKCLSLVLARKTAEMVTEEEKERLEALRAAQPFYCEGYSEAEIRNKQIYGHRRPRSPR